MTDDHKQAGKDIKDGHERHQVRGYRSDTLDTAQDDDGHDKCQNDACHDRSDMKDILHRSRDLIALGNVADTEGCQASDEGEDRRKPSPASAKSVLDIIHGTAMMYTVLIYLAVFDSQRDLREFGEHSEESGKPHPEHRAGSAGKDGTGNARNITCSDRPRQGCSHRLERRQVLTMVFFVLFKQRTDGMAHRVLETGQLNASCTEREVNTRADQKDQHDRPPCKIIDNTVDRFDL